MKILSLNTWGGKAGHENLLDFIKNQGDFVDVFCLQEIWNVKDDSGRDVLHGLLNSIVGGTVLTNIVDDLFPKIGETLPNHQGFFRPHYKNHYGLAMFVKNDLKLEEEGDIFVFKDRDFVPTGDVGNHARNIQYATIGTESGLRTIINFHGLWNGKGKTDTEDRLMQSENIINFTKNLGHPFILCGDFNLLPDTESLKKFEDMGLRNLIKENNITSTRSSLYTKEHKFADYAFVSEGIEVKEFKILPEEVSDHLAMYLDID